MGKPTDDDEDVSFYTSIPSFRKFADVTQKQHFRSVPSTWVVLVGDVVGSTAAIEAGRYRDINTIGAACVVAVRNAARGQQLHKMETLADFPYVFGGDGATMVVPPAWRDAAVDALLALQQLTKMQFQLELRVGAVTVRELESKGASVQVARYEVHSGMCIAMFCGGGLAMADSIVKNEQPPLVPTVKAVEPSLEGLSCRYDAIPSKKGTVVSLLVYAEDESTKDSVYADVLNDLDTILGGSESRPFETLDGAPFKSFRAIVENERRFHANPYSLEFAARLSEIVMCYTVLGARCCRTLFFPADDYEAAIPNHADHKKFDDMLRMVIDCTTEQANDIETMLRAKHEQQLLCYGLHRSRASLMTCFVHDVSDGNHLHFIDGGDGGYAMAAKGLKQQLKMPTKQ